MVCARCIGGTETIQRTWDDIPGRDSAFGIRCTKLEARRRPVRSPDESITSKAQRRKSTPQPPSSNKH